MTKQTMYDREVRNVLHQLENAWCRLRPHLIKVQSIDWNNVVISSDSYDRIHYRDMDNFVFKNELAEIKKVCNDMLSAVNTTVEHLSGSASLAEQEVALDKEGCDGRET